MVSVVGMTNSDTPNTTAQDPTAARTTIQASYLPHLDAEAALAFYRDVLGFEVRQDVGQGATMRWITVGPVGQPDTAIVLNPPAAVPGLTDDERRMLAEVVAKGAYFGVNLATTDLDATFEALAGRGAEVVQEPTDQPWGARDFAVRDPSGNLIRIQQVAS